MILIKRVYLVFLIGILIPIFFFQGPAEAAEKNSTSGKNQHHPLPVVDAAGQTLQLQKYPERIVVVGTAQFIPLHVLYMFPGAGERLAGYERKYKLDEKFLPLIDSHFHEKKILETNPGPEHIAALRPDLVITKRSTKGPLDKSMAALGIPVFHMGLETPERFMKDIENVGIILGNEARAQDIIQYYQFMLDRIDKGCKELNEEKKPRVLTLEYSKRGGSTAVNVPAVSWMQTIQARRAGGRPVWLEHSPLQNSYQIVGFEQIAAWNPDKIFMIVWYSMDSRQVLEKLKNDTKWQKLKAVKNGELHIYPEDIYGWDTPDPRWIMGMTWLATKIHPDRFSDIQMDAEIYRFFNFLFNMDKSVVEKEILPRIKLDEN